MPKFGPHFISGLVWILIFSGIAFFGFSLEGSDSRLVRWLGIVLGYGGGAFVGISAWHLFTRTQLTGATMTSSEREEFLNVHVPGKGYQAFNGEIELYSPRFGRRPAARGRRRGERKPTASIRLN